MKVKPNDKCPCNSNLKYKKCCFLKKAETKYEVGQSVSSPIVISIIDTLQNKYKNTRFIDISDDLNDDTYKEYQIKNYSTNIVMIALKNQNNSLVFLTRVDDTNSDIMLMHKGMFRTFYHKDIEMVLDSLKSII